MQHMVRNNMTGNRVWVFSDPKNNYLIMERWSSTQDLYYFISKLSVFYSKIAHDSFSVSSIVIMFLHFLESVSYTWPSLHSWYFFKTIVVEINGCFVNHGQLTALKDGRVRFQFSPSVRLHSHDSYSTLSNQAAFCQPKHPDDLWYTSVCDIMSLDGIKLSYKRQKCLREEMQRPCFVKRHFQKRSWLVYTSGCSLWTL